MEKINLLQTIHYGASNTREVRECSPCSSSRRVPASLVLFFLAVVLLGSGLGARAQTGQGKDSAPKSGDPAKIQNGKRLYTSAGCYQCHGGEGQGSIQTGGIRLGPPPVELDIFVAYVRQPLGDMPPYASKALSDAQLAEIYAFLQSRPTPPPAKSIPLLND